MGIDRRADGKPRGRDPDPRSLEAYLALPGLQPRLGDPEPQPPILHGWDGDARGVAVKPQRDAFDFTQHCRFSFHPPAIAEGALFLGAGGGLSQPKTGKRRGDIRRPDALEMPKPPEQVDVVIEVILSGGNVADVGKALGAHGGSADRKGGKALRDAAAWAKAALAA